MQLLLSNRREVPIPRELFGLFLRISTMRRTGDCTRK